MLSRPQHSNSQPPQGSRRASQVPGGLQSFPDHTIPRLSALGSEDAKAAIEDAVDLTSSGFSRPDDEMDTFSLGQDLGFGQSVVLDNSPEPELVAPRDPSFRIYAPLPLPSAPHVPRDENNDPSLDGVRSDPNRDRIGRKKQATTTLPGKSKVPDFFPWSNDSAENALNENVIRNGFADKPPGSNQSESHTARPSVWPTLKTKSGLPLLSALLVQVMEKRQASARCAAPSSFKPPPRVTLTDTKREAWLRDLASSDVPLRKLSRTIPHGIRGKTLLDHCLGKTIPIPRAVWLAKCVGANELRAFRRKGISGSAVSSGEAKWVREWTVLVEVFLEHVIADCGHDDWRTKMDYALRLSTTFFAENLLENEHYLSWLVESFQKAPLGKLPAWVIFVQLYWEHLVSRQKRGRRLVEVLLSRLRTFRIDGTLMPNAALVDRLERMVVTLASNHGGCLIAMHTWDGYRQAFEHVLASQEIPRNISVSLARLIARNDRLTFSTQCTHRQTESAKLQLNNVLSSLPIIFDVGKTALRCRNIYPNSQDLVIALLSWASSNFDTGEHRLYVVCSILAHERECGTDIELDLLSALSSLAHVKSFDRRTIHKIFARLAQAEQFSFGRYLQWLISMGALSGARNHSADLLAALPITSCPAHLLNLRRTLLQRMGISFKNDDCTAAYLYHRFHDAMRQMTVDNVSSRALMSSMSQLDTPAQASFAWKIRNDLMDLEDSSGLIGSLCKSPIALRLLTNMCEFLADYDLLASVLQKTSQSGDPAVLSSISDTLSMHAETFGAMGTLHELCTIICRKQSLLRSQYPPDRTLLLSLSRLAARYSTDTNLKKMLAADLVICEQQGSATVCSPASDNMVLARAGTIASDADIDRILASGNTMDEQTMARLFSAIVERCVRQASHPVVEVSTCSRWFMQLRLFDHANFDRLSQNLLAKLVDNAGVEQIRVLLTALVGSDCLDVDVALGAFERRIDSMAASNVAATARLALAGLQIFIPSTIALEAPLETEAYRFRLAQQSVCRLKRPIILHFLKWSFSATSDPSAFLTSANVLALSRRYANEDSQAFTDALVEARSIASDSSRVDMFASRLLNAGMADGEATLTTTDLGGILHILDEYSLPICKVLMKQTAVSDLETGSVDVSAQAEASKQYISHGHSLWPQLIDCLSTRAVKEVYRWASEELMKEMTDFLNRPTSDSVSIQQATTYLKIMAVSASSQTQTADIDMTGVVEKFSAFNVLVEGTDSNDRAAISRMCSWLSIILEFIAACHIMIMTDGTVTTQQGTLLCTCCSLLTQTKLQGQGEVLDNVFDIASLLSSKLCTEQLESVSRQLPRSARSDSRVAFVLGIEQSRNGWLVLASKMPTTANVTSPLTPQGGFVPFVRPGQPPTPLQRTASQTSTSAQSSPTSAQRPQPSSTPQARLGHQEIKYTPFIVRPWETMPDSTPNIGENDTSLSLTLFAARRAA